MGKRRGGNKLALKTGIVAKKQKTEDEVSRLVVAGTTSVAFSFHPQLLAEVPRPSLLSIYLALGWMYWVGEEGGFQPSS